MKVTGIQTEISRVDVDVSAHEVCNLIKRAIKHRYPHIDLDGSRIDKNGDLWVDEYFDSHKREWIDKNLGKASEELKRVHEAYDEITKCLIDLQK